MEMLLPGWSGRSRPNGFVGGVVSLAGALAAVVFLAVLAALGLLVMLLVGVVMVAERLLAALVPAYRRRRERYITMPTGLVRVVRFGSKPTQMIDARAYEVPTEH